MLTLLCNQGGRRRVLVKYKANGQLKTKYTNGPICILQVIAQRENFAEIATLLWLNHGRFIVLKAALIALQEFVLTVVSADSPCIHLPNDHSWAKLCLTIDGVIRQFVRLFSGFHCSLETRHCSCDA